MRKLLSLVLAAVMLLSILNVSVFADGYTVTYYNGSSIVGASATVAAGGNYVLDRVVENTATQYFAGWYLDSSFTTQAKSTITINSNTNLYAKMVDYSSNLTIEAKSGSLWTDGGWASPKHYLRDTYYTYYALIGAYGVADGKYYDLMPEGQHHRHAGGTDSGNSYETADGVTVEKMEHTGSYWTTYGNGNGEYILRQPDGEAFMVKPNTTYNVTLTYKYLKTVDDASHYTKYWLSTGLSNAYPMYSGELNLNDETNTTSNSRGKFNDTANRTFAATTKSDLVLVDKVTDEWTTMTMTITTPSLETYKNGNYLQVLSLSTATTADVKSLWKSVTVEEVLPESCSVTYMNGESVVGIAENIVEGASYTIDRAVANTDTHYFAGWYTDSALTKKATTKITVSEDTTLYAKMVPYASSMSISATQWNYNYRETVSSWYPYHEAYFANYYGVYNGAYKDIVKLNTGTFAGYRTSSESRKVLAYGHSGGYNIGSSFIIMNANGEAFIPKPNTTYKVSVTYASDTTSSSMKIGTAWSLTDTTLKATGDYAFNGKDLNSSSYTIGGGISGNPAATSEAVAQINTNGATTTAEFVITTPSLAEYSGKLQVLGLYGFNVKSGLYGSPVSNNIFFIDSVSVEETVVDTSVDVVYMNGDVQVGDTATLEVGSEYNIDRAVANTDTHYFAGWFTDSALTKKAGTKITVSEDTTLYAKMVPYASSMSVSGSAWKYNYREQVNGWWPHNEIYYGNYYAVSGGAYKDILKVAGGTFAAYGTVNGSKVLSYGHNNDYGIASSYVIMDANGEIFVPKPNTTYKVSVKYFSNTTSSNMKVGTAWPIADTTLKATGDYAFTSATNGYELTTSSPTIGGGIGSTSPAVSSEAVAQVVTSEPDVAEFIITTPTLDEYNGKLQALGIYGFNVKGRRDSYGFYISQVSIEEYTPEYSVTYMNGSAQVGEAVTGLSENASYTIDRVAENTNTHYFAGWYLDPDFNTEALSTITVDGEVTLYAKMVEYKKALNVASSSNYWQGWVSPKHYLRDNYFEYRALVGAYGIKNGKYGDLLSEGYAHRHSGGSGGGNTAIADANGVRNETRDTTGGTWQYYTSGDYILRDANGNAFIVKPDTTYKVTLTYTFDISKNANGKASYFLGTGLDASKLMHSGEMILNDVTGERINSSDYSKYGFTDGTNLSFLSEGVKVELVPTADNKTVELFITTPSLYEYKNNNSLQVLSICDEQSSNTVTSWKSVVVEELGNKLGDVFGHNAVKVADSVEDKHSYKVTVMYKADSATKIGFFTADADNAGTRGYVEGKNVAVYTTSVNNGTVVTADIYITVDKNGNTGEALYLYITQGVENIVIYDAKAEKITNANGGYLIGNAGVSMIDTADMTLNQALRYYFTYDTTNLSDIIINGKSYSIIERGFLYANGSKVNDETVVSRTNIGNSIVGTSTNDFTKCWTTKQNTDGTLNLWFSSYVKDFASEDGSYNVSKRLYVKGYVVVEINGEQFTLYTTESNYTVAEIAALNNFHNEGNFVSGDNKLPIAAGNRSLVWNLEFNGESDYNRITTDTTTMEPNANSTILSVSPSRENIFIEDGNLTLRIKDNGEDAPVRYTTAKSLTTDGKMAFKYGYLEMRAKVPFTTAMFPSFWMQPDKRLLADDFKYYGEVDIFEVYGDAQNLSTTIMKWDHNYNAVAPYGSLVHEMGYRFGKPDEYSSYQIYGMEWTPEHFKFYVNGVLTHTIKIDEEYNSQYPGMECFNDFYYLCWNNFAYEDALDEYWLGDDPDGDGYGEDHVDYVIDYVRLYQNKDTEEIVLY